MKTYITKTTEQTQKLAAELAISLKQPSVITLQGELGAGKTTFTQGFARGLGIKQKIISPTFIIMRKYDIDVKSKKNNIEDFYHVDLYRLENERNIAGTGLLEVINDNKSIVVIEWAEKMGNLLPEKRIDVTFKYLSEREREITVSYL